MLPTPRIIQTHPAYAGLLALLESRYVTTAELARRWRWSVQHMTNMRRAGQGPAYVKMGRAVRYSVAEVAAWEIAGRSPHLTHDRLQLAVAALHGYSLDQRADILAQLESLLAE